MNYGFSVLGVIKCFTLFKFLVEFTVSDDEALIQQFNYNVASTLYKKGTPRNSTFSTVLLFI